MPIPTQPQPVKSGQMFVQDSQSTPLPLKFTHISGYITGPIYSTLITQHFSNPFEQVSEVEYLFPLPESASIAGFELKIGERVIKGKINELEDARQAFNEARQSGQQAALFEQRRPNLFSIQITNLLPQQEITTSIRVNGRVKFQDESYEFMLPMGITPRYHREDAGQESAGVNISIAGKDEPIGQVQIDLSIDAGTGIQSPVSPSHPIRVDFIDENRVKVTLAEPAIPDHDFILRYALSNPEITPTGWVVSNQNNEKVFLACLTPPRLPENITIYPRDFIFVLDRSGSMSGEPIAQARNALRACLRTLTPDDRFNILLFDDLTDWFSPELCPINQHELDRADQFLDQVEGRGGTEILIALEAALKVPNHPQRQKYVIFLTDGAVSAEERALKLLYKQIGQSRLFTFGIGSSVNRYLLNKLAAFGKGCAEFLQVDEDIEEAMIRFQDRISYPLLTNLTIQSTDQFIDYFPAIIPDVYYGQTLEICGRFKSKTKKPRLTLCGVFSGNAVKIEINFEQTNFLNPSIERIWASQKIDELLYKSAELTSKTIDEIRDLALQHQLVTPFTAFTAVDSAQVTHGDQPQKINIAHPLPKGLDISGFIGQAAPSIPRFAPPLPGNIHASFVKYSKALPPIDTAQPFSMPADYTGAANPYSPSSEPFMDIPQISPGTSRADILRHLARTQKANGSWDNDPLHTTLAILAFVRDGHTTQTGIFRSQIRKAIAWIQTQAASGLVQYLLAITFKELSLATNLNEHMELSKKYLSTTPSPTSAPMHFAFAVLNSNGLNNLPDEINTEEDLIKYAITGKKVEADKILLSSFSDDLLYWRSAICIQS